MRAYHWNPSFQRDGVQIWKNKTVRTPLGWYNFMLTLQRPLRLSTQLRLAGLGFKAASRPLGSRRHGIRCRRLLIMRLYGLLPATLWLALASGQVPSPTVIGWVIDRLRDQMVPKDPITVPDKAFAYPGHRDFLEWSLYHGWMKQYLTYLKWYCEVALNPCASLEDWWWGYIAMIRKSWIAVTKERKGSQGQALGQIS